MGIKPAYISIELRFHPCERFYPKRIDNLTIFPNAVPCYVSNGTYTWDNVTYDAVCYQFYYEANAAEGCGWCFCPQSKALGYHPFDVERILVLHNKNGIPSMVYFSAHSKGQGMWVPWAECEKTKDGALVVYVARGGHGTYPEGRTYWRIYGFANDVCSKRGRHLRVTNYIPSPGTKLADGIEVLSGIPQVSAKSITPWQRFWLPQYYKQVRFGKS